MQGREKVHIKLGEEKQGRIVSDYKEYGSGSGSVGLENKGLKFISNKKL